MHTLVTLMTLNATLIPADKIRREDIELMIFLYSNARWKALQRACISRAREHVE